MLRRSALQRNKASHSPKNCLPGSGWTPLNSVRNCRRHLRTRTHHRESATWWLTATSAVWCSIGINRAHRVVASEYKAKFWVMADAVRLNRTDTALVRVVVPIVNRDEDAAVQTATDFVKSFYATLRHIFRRRGGPSDDSGSFTSRASRTLPNADVGWNRSRRGSAALPLDLPLLIRTDGFRRSRGHRCARGASLLPLQLQQFPASAQLYVRIHFAPELQEIVRSGHECEQHDRPHREHAVFGQSGPADFCRSRARSQPPAPPFWFFRDRSPQSYIHRSRQWNCRPDTANSRPIMRITIHAGKR